MIRPTGLTLDRFFGRKGAKKIDGPHSACLRPPSCPAALSWMTCMGALPSGLASCERIESQGDTRKGTLFNSGGCKWVTAQPYRIL